ncbi:unnamed protein product, partial [Ectocarpus sp. 13 AM-2016]
CGLLAESSTTPARSLSKQQTQLEPWFFSMVPSALISGVDGRLLSTTSSEIYDEDDVWTPLQSWDFLHLGVTCSYQVLVLVVVVHLWICRKWPPYVPR